MAEGPEGIALGVLAVFFGAPFLTLYLLVTSYRTEGDVRPCCSVRTAPDRRADAIAKSNTDLWSS